MTLNPWLEEDIAKAISETTDADCGWFRLDCSDPLPPGEALDMYRHRTAVESLISSIKSIVNLQPLRVWSKSSTRGALLLALIAQLIVSMVRYDLEPEIERKRIDGKWVDAEIKPSIDTICRNLVHWTAVLIPREGYGPHFHGRERPHETHKRHNRALSSLFSVIFKGSPDPFGAGNPYFKLTVQWTRNPKICGSLAMAIGQQIPSKKISNR